METATREPKPSKFNGIPVMIHPVGTLQTLRIIGIINRLRKQMKLTKEDLAGFSLSAGGIFGVLSHIMEGISDGIDTNAEDPDQPTGIALTLFREIGLTVRDMKGNALPPEVIAAAPLDATIGILREIAIAEAETSLGKQIRAMFERISNIFNGVMTALESPPADLSGGQSTGGPIESSIQSTENTGGQKTTSLVSPSSES